jgi:hypothetical protein
MIIFMLRTRLCRPIPKRTQGSDLRRPWRRLWDHGTYLPWTRRHPNVTCGGVGETNLVEMSLKVWEGSREHLITFEIEGEGIEDGEATFRVSIKNLKTDQVHRAQCVVPPSREDTEDSDD